METYMLLLSLGPDALIALMRSGDTRGFSGPDLSWLLFGPDSFAIAQDEDPPGDFATRRNG